VDGYIRISMEMGKVVCVPDPEAARGRDAAFFGGQVPPPPPFPGVSGGVIATDASGQPEGCAGQLLPHDELEKDGVTARLDALTGRAFVLLVKSNSLQPDATALAKKLGIPVVAIGPDGYRDRHGRLSARLLADGVVAILARPDFFAFGSASSPEGVVALLQNLSARLAA
jgi:hypothetical protein